jgi:hypothetical protein
MAPCRRLKGWSRNGNLGGVRKGGGTREGSGRFKSFSTASTASPRSKSSAMRFAYIAPTYKQGKAIAWDYLKHYSAPIPGVEKNESELWVQLPNEARVRIFGADNPDSLRGIYLDGVVLDEYGMMARNTFSEVLRPALSDRKGWAAFIGTPNGKNQFWEVAATAQTEPGWYYACHRASETGIVQADELTAARRMMTADEYDQEFECSFEASVKGAIYDRTRGILRWHLTRRDQTTATTRHYARGPRKRSIGARWCGPRGARNGRSATLLTNGATAGRWKTR